MPMHRKDLKEFFRPDGQAHKQKQCCNVFFSLGVAGLITGQFRFYREGLKREVEADAAPLHLC